MTQWFRGNIEGYYVGKPARPGTLGGGNARGFQLVIYRAAIRDVELLDFVPPPPLAEPSAGEPSTSEPSTAEADAAASPVQSDVMISSETNAELAKDTPADESETASTKAVSGSHAPTPEREQPPLALPPWLPAPGTAFFQPTITDARLFPVRHAMGWFEGPVHQVFIEDFRSTHSKQHGQQLYGRFLGRAHGYFALPPPPRQEAAERLVQAFQDLPDDAIAPDASPSDAHKRARELARDHAEVIGASADTLAAEPPDTVMVTANASVAAATRAASPADLHGNTKPDAPPAITPAKTPPPAVGGKVPFSILVMLVAAALLLTCGAPRALLWLFFLLPTLLVRRVLVGLIPDSTALRGFAALVTVCQAWLAGMVFVGWWETGCRDVHPVPLIGTLVGLVIATVLPFDIPLLVNATTLAAMLIGWCTGKDACTDEAQTMRDESYESPIPAFPENNHS
jgi:hypothetical protein